jgi:hypothetical protein
MGDLVINSYVEMAVLPVTKEAKLDVISKSDVPKKEAITPKSALEAMKVLSGLESSEAKDLSGRIKNFSQAVELLKYTKEEMPFILGGVIGGEVIGGMLGIVVEISLLAAGVTSAGVVLGATLGTWGVIWVAGIIAGTYWHNQSRKEQTQDVELHKVALKESLDKNKDAVKALLENKMLEAQKKKEDLLTEQEKNKEALQDPKTSYIEGKLIEEKIAAFPNLLASIDAILKKSQLALDYVRQLEAESIQ